MLLASKFSNFLLSPRNDFQPIVDLNFSLENLSSLSSNELALVMFHPYALKGDIYEARLEFMRRRSKSLESQYAQLWNSFFD